MGAIFDAIHHKLTAAFQPTRLEIDDDSARHHGHEGAAHGFPEYAVEIVRFKN